MDLSRRNQYSFIALIEPFLDPSQIEEYNRRLSFRYAATKFSGKIWYFWKE